MADFDTTQAALRAPPKGLAALIHSTSGPARPWGPEELAAVFSHQMSAPVLLDLGAFDPGLAGRLRNLSDAQGLLLKSFAELFRHPLPPLELLEMAKEFGKANRDSPDSGLPPEIAAEIYYLSIAAAWVRRGVRISRLSDADLRRGFSWAAEREWADAETRALLTQALQNLDRNEQ